MKTTRQQVNAIRVEAVCDCGCGMTRGNVVYLTAPETYTYYCEMCGHKETSEKAYPRIEYELSKIESGAE